jgi:hypothetical protein
LIIDEDKENVRSLLLGSQGLAATRTQKQEQGKEKSVWLSHSEFLSCNESIDFCFGEGKRIEKSEWEIIIRAPRIRL